MKLSEIQDLIKFVSKSNVSEVELETKEFKIIIKTSKNSPVNHTMPQQVVVQSVPSVAPTVVTAPPTTPQQEVTQQKPVEPQSNTADENKNYHVVKSPMIGTFYRSSTPDKPPFVNIGDAVDLGQPLCIIEAMKLFNEIESDVKGKIIKILVENATPVEYDQPLFLIDTTI